MVTRNYTNNPGSGGWVANEGRYAEEEAGKGWVSSSKVRLFVNDKRIQFVNPVHELVEPTLVPSWESKSRRVMFRCTITGDWIRTS